MVGVGNVVGWPIHPILIAINELFCNRVSTISPGPQEADFIELLSFGK